MSVIVLVDLKLYISDDDVIERQLLRLPTVLFGVICPPGDANDCGTGEITTN